MEFHRLSKRCWECSLHLWRTSQEAYFGWYWKAFLDPTWDKVAEAGEIPDQFERFGAMSWQLPIRELKLMDTPTPNRLQIISSEDDQGHPGTEDPVSSIIGERGNLRIHALT